MCVCVCVLVCVCARARSQLGPDSGRDCTFVVKISCSRLCFLLLAIFFLRLVPLSLVHSLPVVCARRPSVAYIYFLRRRAALSSRLFRYQNASVSVCEIAFCSVAHTPLFRIYRAREKRFIECVRELLLVLCRHHISENQSRAKRAIESIVSVQRSLSALQKERNHTLDYPR